MCRLLAVEARTAHDRFGLTHISILHASGDIGNLNHNLRSTPIATCRDQCAMRSRASPSPHAQHEFKRHNFKQRILRTLNLEDTPRIFRAFAIERSRGVCCISYRPLVVYFMAQLNAPKRFHVRPGDAGPFCGFADDAREKQNAGGSAALHQRSCNHAAVVNQLTP